MSLTFELDDDVDVFSLAQLREESGIRNLECVFSDDNVSENELLSGVTHLYVPGETCFAPELIYDKRNQRYSIRVFAASCFEDYKLAFKLIASLAPGSNSIVVGEDETKTTVDQLPQIYGEQWITEQVEAGFSTVLRIGSSNCASAPGALREFYFGPRMLGEIAKDRNREEQKQEFYRRVRSVQYVDPEYFVPTIYKLDSNETFATLGWDVQYFFPSVKLFALPGADNSDPLLFVPYSKILELQQQRVTLIDERQGLLLPIPQQEWKSFLRDSKPFAAFKS